MNSISKEVIASIIIEFYTKKSNVTQECLAERIGVDHSSISNWLHRKNNISNKKFDLLLSLLSDDAKTNRICEFSSFLVKNLCIYGFDKSKCETILKRDEDIPTLLNELISQYPNIASKLLSRLNVSSIISRVRSLCHMYEDYIAISDQQLGASEHNPTYNQWISCSNDTEDPTLVTQQNYLILNFPNCYRVAIVLTNHTFQDIIPSGDSVRNLKEKNNLNLIIIFTDNEIHFTQQRYFMETYNLFFETITQYDLSKIKLPNIMLGKINANKDVIESDFYAQVVFERLTSYFAVIRNETIFKQFDQNKTELIKSTLKDNNDLFKGFVDKVLLKEIFRYSYLSRHTIYFERARLREKVVDLLNKHNKKKLGTVIEICFPNSFLSSAISEYCDDLLLFTSSNQSLDFFRKINKDNDSMVFPENVQFNLSHINPQYLSNQFGEKIIGKVDLVILGFGMGSSLINITEYLRYMNSWLTPNGSIFISFANSESVILHKQFNLHDYLEITPLYFSDYWQYTATETLKFLARIKRYTVDEAKRLISTYVDDFSCYTYPFLSGLINVSQNDKWIRDEVRSIDKEYSCKGNSKHGHYITVIGSKNQEFLLKNVSPEKKSIQIHGYISDYIEQQNIEYEKIEHAVTIDTNSLFKALLEKGEDITQFDLIKTVILQRTNYKSNELNVIYVITPRDYKIRFNPSKYKLLPERKISQLFGTGSISPLVILPSVKSFTKCTGNVYISGFNHLSKEYAIISSGINSSSIKMKRKSFMNILQKSGCENITETTLI